MSKMRFFKCRFPKTKRYASNGQTINFIDVGGDVGVGKTDNDWLAKEIDGMIAEQRGGVFAIDEAEYEGLKKNPTSSTPSAGLWREELSRRGPERDRKPLLQSLSTALERDVAETSEEAEPAPTVSEPLTKPKATKRA